MKYFYIIFSERSGIIYDSFSGSADQLKEHLKIILDDAHTLQSVEEVRPDGTTKEIKL